MAGELAREVFWARVGVPGLEHLRLLRQSDWWEADGLVLGCDDGRGWRVRYHVAVDAGWQARACTVTRLDDGHRLELHRDGAGWLGTDGKPLPELAGAEDVDITVTPFTNTLPIRRLAWTAGQARELTMAWISVPELTVRAAPQRYTCLRSIEPAGGRFRYEGIGTGFTVELDVDPDGLVLDYGTIWRRLSAEPA